MNLKLDVIMALNAVAIEQIEKSNTTRNKAFKALGKHYATEVPLYDTLLQVIEKNNAHIEQVEPGALKEMGLTKERLTEERHGAIRVGTAKELNTFKDIFEIMGMKPVNYYDLTTEDHPIHSTAFRPISDEAISKNPSRIFCSLLRTDLLPKEVQEDVKKYLDSRKIFSDDLLNIIKEHKKNGGFKNEAQETQFISEVVKVLQWDGKSDVPAELFEKVKKFSAIAADILAGPNINHLTPVAIGKNKKAIKMVHEELEKLGIATIPTIQGPPLHIHVLLNQSSFKAIPRELSLKKSDGSTLETTHQTQFGEFESRYLALKPEGMKLYQKHLKIAVSTVNDIMDKYTKNFESLNGKIADLSPEQKKQFSKDYDKFYKALYPEILKAGFAEFPKDYDKPGEQSLGYFTYHATKKGKEAAKNGDLKGSHSLDELLEKGYVKAKWIVYEDFLPASAARIFDSNLENAKSKLGLEFKSDAEYKAYNKKFKAEFERALGRKLIDMHDIYAAKESRSIIKAFDTLGINNKDKAKVIELNKNIQNDPVTKEYGRQVA